MFSKCANPACQAEFDYWQGRYYRFHRRPLDDGQPANTHSVQHFWLCGKCCETYSLAYAEGGGILITLNLENAFEPDTARMIAVD
jgi:hypothetical protein